MLKRTLICSLIFVMGIGCQNSNKVDIEAQYLHRAMKQLTDIIVHDIFSPPVASRIYTYPSIAAYECMIQDTVGYRSLAGQLNEFESIPMPTTKENINFQLAGLEAFICVGTQLIFSEQMMDEFKDDLYKQIKSTIPKKVFNQSIDYGSQVADHILQWAGQDNYKQTRTFEKFITTRDPARWKPTPPDYMEGIEPHWNKIRPFVLDSATQFIPAPPPLFDTSKSSDFFLATQRVYDAVKNASEEEVAIASFWDCNPYVSHHRGHLMFATKKITPGGHWVGITKIACEKADVDIIETSRAYALTTIALADAFISCWDEKYRSNLIRPETVINEYIDEDWAPILQTPPFPEHTSGHSVISSSASVALTHLFGDSFSYIDSVEFEYGLPPRSFDSFYEASSEAAISRLYGGIHYMPAITEGVKQGKAVGNFVVENLQMH